MPFPEDLTAFINTDEFASSVLIDGVAVKGIFDKAYNLSSGGLNGFSSTQPMLILPTNKVPLTPVGKPVIVNGEAYTIEVHEPDGTGISSLMLQGA